MRLARTSEYGSPRASASQFAHLREQPLHKTLKAFQTKAWGQPRSGATPGTRPALFRLACGPSSPWSAAKRILELPPTVFAADQGLDGRKGEEPSRQVNLGWRSRLGRSLTPGFDLKRFQRLSRSLLRVLGVLVIAVSICGCGGDDASHSDSANSESVERVTPPKNTGTSRPGQAGLANTQNQFNPPVVPSPRKTSSGTALAEPASPKPPQKLFRPSYEHTEHDPQRLANLGLSRFNTKHLQLITDLPGEQVEPLAQLVDALQPFLEEYFGKLPPAFDKSEYRITGFVMDDRNRFVQARLAKADLLDSFHGRQIGAEFWMNNQTLDYYRRHLLLHEAVHCYMRHLPGEAGFPMWYLEGMAEMIATHHRGIDEPEVVPPPSTPPPEFTFNVMPAERMRFRGLERIIILQRDVKKNGVRSIAQIRALTGNDFKKGVEAYAWCWALCRFLDSHPGTKEQFRRLARSFISPPTSDLADADYHPPGAINSFFYNASANLETEWALFVSNIEHGYDFDSHAIVFQAGRPLEADLQVAEIDSGRSWQTTLLKVEAGKTYSVSAAGQFDLEAPPTGVPSPEPEKPAWISEANGISIRYHKGQPLGRLLGAVHVETEPHSMLRTIPLGNSTTFTALQTGTLYLRINDWPNSLAGNKGKLSVTIRKFAERVSQAPTAQ